MTKNDRLRIIGRRYSICIFLMVDVNDSLFGDDHLLNIRFNCHIDLDFDFWTKISCKSVNRLASLTDRQTGNSILLFNSAELRIN